MNADEINKKLKKNGFGEFSVHDNGEGLVLSGECDSWNRIVEAGFCAAEKYGKQHIINDVRYTGDFIPKMRTPQL